MFLAAASLASAGISTGLSIAQAVKQNRLMQEADKKAAEAMSNVMKSLGINTYKNLSINKETYKDMFDNLLASAGMAMEAGREGDERGAAATAGRVLAGVTDAGQKIRDTKAQEMMDLQKLVAGEESRLRDIKAQIGLEEVAGAQEAAADAQKAKTQAITNAAAGLTSMVKEGAGLVPLYQKDKATKQLLSLEKDYQSLIKAGQLDQKYIDANGNPIPFEQYLVKSSGLDENKFMKQVDDGKGNKSNIFDANAIRDYFINTDKESLNQLYQMGMGGSELQGVKPSLSDNKIFEMFPALRNIIGQ